MLHEKGESLSKRAKQFEIKEKMKHQPVRRKKHIISRR